MAMFGYARVSTRDQDFAGQVAELTTAGAPVVSDVIEHDRKIVWSTTSLRTAVVNTEVPAFGFAEVPDTLALLAWLHKDALIAALDREIATEADDDAALTHEARQQREAEVLAAMLAIERDESWLVWTALAQNLPVFHRNDCSPLAVLQCRLITAAAVNASPGSTSGMSYELRR
jgi:hypothetical protein